MYRPTRSRTFSTRSGSGDTLKLSWSQGLSPNAFQISATVSWLMPYFLARPRVDQWVASGGADSNVSTRTASITSSPTVRAAPGRGGVGQPLEPVDGEAAAPLGHRDRVDFELSGDLGVSTTVRRSQHYAGTQRQHLG